MLVLVYFSFFIKFRLYDMVCFYIVLIYLLFTFWDHLQLAVWCEVPHCRCFVLGRFNSETKCCLLDINPIFFFFDISMTTSLWSYLFFCDFQAFNASFYLLATESWPKKIIIVLHKFCLLFPFYANCYFLTVLRNVWSNLKLTWSWFYIKSVVFVEFTPCYRSRR